MSTKNKLLILKQKLLEEIQKEESDNDTILSLSNQIAELDESTVRFSVDAGIINRLGKELVGRQETAVSELVKNSYDADATEVKLTFENARNIGGRLLIEDNGAGMTRGQLISGFMRLSSSDKIHNPVSGKYKRIRAGKKGIGRFATQRLGRKLTIISQTLNNNKALKVTIEWDNFHTDKDLFSVTNLIQEVDKTKEEGTDLIIEDLREAWSDAMIKRVYRYTSDLLQPFPLSKKRKQNERNRVDPGFRSSYFRKEADMDTPIMDEEEAVFKQALAEIEGYVTKDNQGCWSLKSEKLGFEEEVFLIGKDREAENSKFQYIRGIHFKCYYFVYDPSLFSPSTFTFIRDLANEKGGIRLYRNGFRVLPYGEKGNDWLGLDESTRRRAIVTPHQNISFFGFVEISEEAADLFEETSSREGVIENEAFHELIDFVYRCIASAVIKVAELRGRKGTASQRNWKPEDETPTQAVDQAISELDELLGLEDDEPDELDGESRKYKEALKKLKVGREKEKQQFDDEKKTLIEEINMLRVLAGLGLVIGEFVHEVKRFLPAFDADTRFLKELLKPHVEGLKRAERLDINLKSFTVYTSYFDKAISANVLRELKPINLRDVVNDFEEVITNDINRSRIKYNPPEFEVIDIVTLPMHPSEWASILFNLYTNSKKAIKRRRSKGEIFIKCGIDNDLAFLEFSDNGDGIPEVNKQIIFNAFFTTTSAAGHSANESESLSGSGLGLKIIKDIIESYGGNIFVATPSKGYITTMRIEIPLYKN